MKIADFLRGVASVAIVDVNAVFDKATAVVQAAPFLPQNIKDDLTKLIADAKGDMNGLVGLGATLAGQAAADAVDNITTLLMNTAQAVTSSGTDMAKLSVAEKTILMQTWTAMKAQGDVLVAQLHSGLNPAAPPPAVVQQ
jgi:hypothetical protein